MNTRIFRRAVFAVGLFAALLVAAPAAFAHTNVSIGIGFSGPGYRVGIGNCFNCYGYRPYYAPAYYPGTVYYSPAYYPPAYYAPAYYAPAPVYYQPAPVYGTVYYSRGYYPPRAPYPPPRAYYGGNGYYYHH